MLDWYWLFYKDCNNRRKSDETCRVLNPGLRAKENTRCLNVEVHESSPFIKSRSKEAFK